MAPVRYIDVKIRYAYARLKRKLALYITLWFLALLAAVSLIIDSIFLTRSGLVLKVWSTVLVVILGAKLAYDASSKMRTEYAEFRREYGSTKEYKQKFGDL